MSTFLEDNLTSMVIRAVEKIEAELQKPPELRKNIDIPVTLDGFINASTVNKLSIYRNAVKAIAEKYTVSVRIYQGTTRYS